MTAAVVGEAARFRYLGLVRDGSNPIGYLPGQRSDFDEIGSTKQLVIDNFQLKKNNREYVPALWIISNCKFITNNDNCTAIAWTFAAPSVLHGSPFGSQADSVAGKGEQL